MDDSLALVGLRGLLLMGKKTGGEGKKKGWDERGVEQEGRGEVNCAYVA